MTTEALRYLQQKEKTDELRRTTEAQAAALQEFLNMRLNALAEGTGTQIHVSVTPALNVAMYIDVGCVFPDIATRFKVVVATHRVPIPNLAEYLGNMADALFSKLAGMAPIISAIREFSTK